MSIGEDFETESAYRVVDARIVVGQLFRIEDMIPI